MKFMGKKKEETGIKAISFINVFTKSPGASVIEFYALDRLGKELSEC